MTTESHEHPTTNGSAPAPSGWRCADQALRDIRTLGDDWDGAGARAPLPEVVDAAIRISATLTRGGWPEPASTSASPSGTIVMSWQENGEYLEIEVVSAFVAEWMAVNQSGAATHGTFTPEQTPSTAFWH